MTAPLPSAAADATILKGLSRTAISTTWVPWTHGRLASWTGYGAGVSSPGWYHHLFTTTDEVVTRWLVDVAGVLRDEDLPVSSAHIIEAVRLTEALAALRGRPVLGLAEVTEATRAVLCDGDEVRLSLVQRRVVVGELLGQVPDQRAGRTAGPGPPGQPETAEAGPGGAAPRPRPGPAQAQPTWPAAICCTACACWRSAGGTGARQPPGQGHVLGVVAAGLEPEFAVDLVAASGYGTTVITAAAAKAAEAAAKAPTWRRSPPWSNSACWPT